MHSLPATQLLNWGCQGRYTWGHGKLETLRPRDQARVRWGSGFTLSRFHDALLRLGSPPLGLMPAALDQ
jgi:uncharacterized protein (DUF885 family)